ncbi:MAG TPA: NAD(P)H-hydrate dehydratase [Anaerolineales bacterium]|nr:NAD(P)H-hydrate dehydratase [Anaerolineales bacterium]
MKLVSTVEMQKVELEADTNGLSYAMMMEHAGLGLAEQVAARYGALRDGGILGLVGSGNNGGDALVALAKMAEWGWKATAYLVRTRPEADPLLERLATSGGTIIDGTSDEKFKQLKSTLMNNAIVMDGILGTGIKLPLRGTVKNILGYAQKFIAQLESKPVIVAVDCPSGVDCDNGEAAKESMSADMTVTMAAVKIGLLRFPSNNLIGELSIVGIGLDDHDKRSETWQSIKKQVATATQVRNYLPVRERDAHKGTFGTALIIAGSVNFTGAALLAGKAAYRVGVGLVTLGVPSPLHPALAGQFPEGTWLLLPHEMGVIAEGAAEIVLQNLGNASALLIGPGFGLEDTTKKFVNNLLSTSPGLKKSSIGFISPSLKGLDADNKKLPPLVIDADGLKLLAQITDWTSIVDKPAVLTPHPGEMAILTGLEVGEIQKDRIAVAETYAETWGHVVVLKGANTVIAEPGGRTAVVPVANPALARAGTGDVLAGIITGLRAQGLGAFESAVSGSWIHAQSGLLSARRMGTSTAVLAGDLVDSLPEVFSSLEA